MSGNSMFRNYRWWLCLPVLIVGFVVLLLLLVIGEFLVITGNFIQKPYHSSPPEWLKKMERFIRFKDDK